VKRDFLDALLTDYNAYVDQLVDLDSAERELLQLAAEYHNYIEERVLWIRSNDALWGTSFWAAGQEGLAVLHPGFWRATGRAIIADFRAHPQFLMLGVLVFAPLFLYRRFFRRRLREFGHAAEQSACRRFDFTLRALFWTVVIAALYPGVLAAAGWRLAVLWTDFEDAQPTGIARGCLAAAYVYFPLEFLRQVCRASGLARSHFGWPAAGVEALRRDLKWLMALGLPLTACAAALEIAHVLGRLAFIAGMLLAALFVHRSLRPSGAAMRHFLAYAQNRWVNRLRYSGYVAGVAAPVSLASLAALGYYYTAQQLALRLHVGAAPQWSKRSAAAPLSLPRPREKRRRSLPLRPLRSQDPTWRPATRKPIGCSRAP
jgi:potassium efflux system protein